MRLLSSVLASAALVSIFAQSAFAETAEAAVSSGIDSQGLSIIGIAFAVVGGAWSQSKVVQFALENIGRNPGAAGQMFLPWMLALVFIESLVIYALVIALKIVGMI